MTVNAAIVEEIVYPNQDVQRMKLSQPGYYLRRNSLWIALTEINMRQGASNAFKLK